jgi:hypothetical protein
LYLTFTLLNEPAERRDIQLLYVAIFLSIGATILYIFEYDLESQSYSIFLILIALGTATGLTSNQRSVVLMYNFLLGIPIFILISISFDFQFGKTHIADLNNIFEFILVISFWAYFLYLKPKWHEIFITSLVFILGISFGSFISNKDTPSLIFNVIVNQTLSIGQTSWGFDRFGMSVSFTPDDIFALHIGIIFASMTLMMLKRRSIPAIAIILTGFNVSYPPLGGLRALAVLLFVKQRITIEQTSELENYEV